MENLSSALLCMCLHRCQIHHVEQYVNFVVMKNSRLIKIVIRFCTQSEFDFLHLPLIRQLADVKKNN
jgi:hypothetical protein